MTRARPREQQQTMANMLLNRWFQLGTAIAITAVAGVVIGVLIAESETVASVKDVAGTVATGEFPEDSAFVGQVMFTTGASIPMIVDEYGGRPRLARDATDQTLPLTATKAVAAGWTDPILCSVSRGRYFQNGPVGEDYSHFLMYNTADQLISIYLFSEAEMPAPWERQDSLDGAGGLTIIDYEHWGLLSISRTQPGHAIPPGARQGAGQSLAPGRL